MRSTLFYDKILMTYHHQTSTSNKLQMKSDTFVSDNESSTDRHHFHSSAFNLHLTLNGTEVD